MGTDTRTRVLPVALLAILVLLVGDLQAAGVPPEGIVLQGGQAARIMARTGSFMPGKSLTVGARPFPGIETLRRPPGRKDMISLMRLESIRHDRFEHYQKKIKLQSAGDGLLTEFGYREGRQAIEGEQAQQNQGKPSGSLGKKLLRGLFGR